MRPFPAADRSSLSASAAASFARSLTHQIPPRLPAALNSAPPPRDRFALAPQHKRADRRPPDPRGSGPARAPRMAALDGCARRGSWRCRRRRGRRRAAEQARRDWVRGWDGVSGPVCPWELA
uniref:Uncharacterized protein n=2 Tax=Setaria TaxID=4554 RepID=K3ZAT7_SETIT|nr:hypothetical protein SEVIR_3G048650v2 [Setaria viridis]